MPPCDFCAGRHKHFALWVPFTYKEFTVLMLLAMVLGVMLGWMSVLIINRIAPAPWIEEICQTVRSSPDAPRP